MKFDKMNNTNPTDTCHISFYLNFLFSFQWRLWYVFVDFLARWKENGYTVSLVGGKPTPSTSRFILIHTMGEEVLKGFVLCVEIENLCLFNNLLVFQYLLASYCSTMLNGPVGIHNGIFNMENICEIMLFASKLYYRNYWSYGDTRLTTISFWYRKLQSRSLFSCKNIKIFVFFTFYTTISHSRRKDILKESV